MDRTIRQYSWESDALIRGYLSDGEAARDRDRTTELVRSIAGSKPVNSYIISSEKTKPAWYEGRLCDSCGTKLQLSSWRCKKCDIGLSLKCSKQIRYFKRKSFLCCPMCDGKLE